MLLSYYAHTLITRFSTVWFAGVICLAVSGSTALFDSSVALGADTQATITDFPCSIIGCLGNDGTGVSSLALTGYTVLDSSGNVVADASVTEVGPTDFNFFVPEPSSVGLALLGFAALLLTGRRNGFRERSDPQG